MELQDISDKKREIGVLVGIIIILIVLWYLGTTVVSPRPITLSFAQGEVSPGEETTLVVRVSNLLDKDVKNVTVLVKPESEVIQIQDPERIETVIGRGSYRELKFPLKVSSGTTPGSYAIEVRVKMGGEEYSELTHLVVK